MKPIQELLKNAPCYGNDDRLRRRASAADVDRHGAGPTPPSSGREIAAFNVDARYVPFTSHVPFGKVVAATPNGRVAVVPAWLTVLPRRTAPTTMVPTAILLSNHNTKNYGMRARACPSDRT